LVHRNSQKGIVIGAKGAKLKKIDTDTRIHIERLDGMQVNLKTHVKVKSGWSYDYLALKSLGSDLI
ncbi:KH domain-containing protein, partial [Francisella tularensis]|uniref:KH domain-containing protein n=1 Tax=Francisella tularensis TaxID=263 RepID=UPI002381C78F